MVRTRKPKIGTKLSAVPERHPGGKGNQSALSRWLARNQKRVTSMREEQGMLWADVALVAYQEGIARAPGKPFSHVDMSRSWNRLKARGKVGQTFARSSPETEPALMRPAPALPALAGPVPEPKPLSQHLRSIAGQATPIPPATPSLVDSFGDERRRRLVKPAK